MLDRAEDCRQIIQVAWRTPVPVSDIKRLSGHVFAVSATGLEEPMAAPRLFARSSMSHVLSPMPTISRNHTFSVDNKIRGIPNREIIVVFFKRCDQSVTKTLPDYHRLSE